jgi:putative transposase
MISASDTISSVLKVLKCKLYPNARQSRHLAEYIEASRQTYNRALEHRIHAVKANGKGIDYNTQTKQLTLQRKVDPSIAAVPCEVERDGLRRVDAGFKNFFRRCKEGAKRKGFPRFKSRTRYNSFTDASASNCLKDGRVKIVGIERPIRCRGLQPGCHSPKRVTIKRIAGEWFARILIDDQQPTPSKRPIKRTVGIDMGLNHFLATSDGEFVDCPKHYRKLQPALRRAQRLVSRRKKGSNRRKLALLRVQRIHAKIANCRDDFTHKLSKKLVDNYDLIAAEKLNIRGMVRSNLAKSILDAGWGIFLFRCGYKALNARATFIQGNPAGTSQECSQCGQTVPKGLSVRIHECSCGLRIDRDVNAGRNVLFRALQKLSTLPEAIRDTR